LEAGNDAVSAAAVSLAAAATAVASAIATTATGGGCAGGGGGGGGLWSMSPPSPLPPLAGVRTAADAPAGDGGAALGSGPPVAVAAVPNGRGRGDRDGCDGGPAAAAGDDAAGERRADSDGREDGIGGRDRGETEAVAAAQVRQPLARQPKVIPRSDLMSVCWLTMGHCCTRPVYVTGAARPQPVGAGWGVC